MSSKLKPITQNLFDRTLKASPYSEPVSPQLKRAIIKLSEIGCAEGKSIEILAQELSATLANRLTRSFAAVEFATALAEAFKYLNK